MELCLKLIRYLELKVSEEQLFYLMSRGISEEEATEMIVMGFIEPFTKES
jgi:Fe-S cluster assembly scaffold protein SufB